MEIHVLIKSFQELLSNIKPDDILKLNKISYDLLQSSIKQNDQDTARLKLNQSDLINNLLKSYYLYESYLELENKIIDNFLKNGNNE